MNAVGVQTQQNPPTYVGGSPVATQFASRHARKTRRSASPVDSCNRTHTRSPSH
ncbi:MAG: hypothetical protein ACRCUY_09185 [Thermoguttaceae bacterium]